MLATAGAAAVASVAAPDEASVAAGASAAGAIAGVFVESAATAALVLADASGMAALVWEKAACCNKHIPSNAASSVFSFIPFLWIFWVTVLLDGWWIKKVDNAGQ